MMTAMKALLGKHRLLRALCLLLLAILAGCEVVNAPPPGASPPAATAALPPSPTAVPPATLLAEAMALRAIGDDRGVGERLSLLLEQFPAADEAREARYYLAESFARRGRWTSAAEVFRTVAEPPGPADQLGARATFWLALAAEASGDWAGAVAAYDRYLAMGAILAPYAGIRQAAQYEAGGQLEAAATGYERAAQARIVGGERAGSYEKAIAIRRRLDQPERVLALYQALLGLARPPEERARIMAEAIEQARALGRLDQARAWLLETIETAPATVYAAAAVDTLLAASDPGLSAATAGTVYFQVERYGEAAPLLEAAIGQANDQAAAAALQHMHGLALRALGDYGGALAGLAAAAAADPNSETGRQAQLDWIQTLGQSGETAQAATAYRQFAESYTDDARAPEALAREAILRERLGDPGGAGQTRLELARRFPSSPQAAEWLHPLGLELFQAGRFAEAEAIWLLLSASTDPYERSRGAFWAGRAALQRGDGLAARQYYENARSADFDSYYSTRAADELGGDAPGAIPIDAPLTPADWESIAGWIGSWPGQDATPPPSLPDAELYGQRAGELAALGLHREAMAEWNELRDLHADQPYGLLAALRAAHEAGATYNALSMAAVLQRLAPEGAGETPLALQRLLFPTPYPALVADQAREHQVDPRLLYALMRQESLFDPQATSWVGARGLAQVMPETGAGIAQNLGVSDFQLDDLYRPVVSIRFGAFYLGRRIQDMSGSLQGALAAYNGGLGNAMRWAGGSVVADPDLFTELIDFPETENYVKYVYGNYGAYRKIYGQP